jgi:hypothetical protein
MPEAGLPTDGSHAAYAKRGIRWDAVAAIIASLVGLLALIVAAYTAYIQRQQVRAQVWPHLHIAQSAFPPSIGIENQGTGPAIVRSVEVLVDGKPQPDWDHVFAAIGMHGDINTQGPSIGGYVFAPSRVVNWLNFEFTHEQYRSLMSALEAESPGNARPVSSAPGMDYESLAGKQRVLFRQFLDDAKRSRFQIRICYCSTLGDCRLATWVVGQRKEQVQECEAIPQADEFRE